MPTAGHNGGKETGEGRGKGKEEYGVVVPEAGEEEWNGGDRGILRV
jgi:hypothetical protein